MLHMCNDPRAGGEGGGGGVVVPGVVPPVQLLAKGRGPQEWWGTSARHAGQDSVGDGGGQPLQAEGWKTRARHEG